MFFCPPLARVGVACAGPRAVTFVEYFVPSSGSHAPKERQNRKDLARSRRNERRDWSPGARPGPRQTTARSATRPPTRCVKQRNASCTEMELNYVHPLFHTSV